MRAAIDPGIGGSGVAVFLEAGTLARASYVKSPLGGDAPAVVRARAVASEVARFLWGKLSPRRMLIELPQVYRASRSRGDPNDLITLALVVGALGASFPHVEVATVLPRTWKGTTDPDALIERVKGRLSPEELARVELPAAASQAHNVWDAVGIGLWDAGRLERRRVVAR